MFTGLDWSILWRPPFGEQLRDAILQTVQIAFYAWVAALVLGLLVGIAREAPAAPIRALATAHVELFRNIPVLVQLFFIYYVLPRLLPPAERRALFDLGWEMWSAVLTLALYSSAKIAEHVRAGLNAVGGQIRIAALATGLTWWQSQRQVVLPLLLRIIAPNLTSEFVTIFKGSSLAMTVGVAETAYVTQQIGTETFHWVEANTLGTAVYLLCAWIIAGLMGVIERRTRVPGLIGAAQRR
ncbi:MAG TPA: amino acid ABC transporter permease [Acetobacteraceae bacterium]|nr:amino acid ABC transporter permease [Acetobacteraceae bacterium]